MNGGMVVVALLALVVIAAIAIGRARKSRPLGPSRPLDPAEVEHHRDRRSPTPDNPGLEWRIHQLGHRNGLLFTEVEPTPDEVGYPRFQFVFSVAGASEADHIATYCLDGDTYTLLSTSRNAPKMPRVLSQT
ncbi:MAG: hypothetical protein JRG85_13360 [Deltaproteobacteria bacterium]|nr:hypothetical protein [Deltaproteobacteria bacterium]